MDASFKPSTYSIVIISYKSYLLFGFDVYKSVKNGYIYLLIERFFPRLVLFFAL